MVNYVYIGKKLVNVKEKEKKEKKGRKKQLSRLVFRFDSLKGELILDRLLSERRLPREREKEKN